MALIHNTNYMDADESDDEPEGYEGQDRENYTDDQDRESYLVDFAEYDDESTHCPMCNGEGVPLGSLGNLDWYRCRYCGADYCIGNNQPD